MQPINTYAQEHHAPIAMPPASFSEKSDIHISTLLHELKEAIVNVHEKLRIDSLDGAGNTALHRLCLNEKLDTQKILLLLSHNPNSFISNDDGVSVASMLLERKELAAIEELKNYVNLDCALRLGTVYEQYTPLASTLCNIIREYNGLTIEPSVLYYAHISHTKGNSSATLSCQSILKTHIDCQDSQDRTLLHLIAQNILNDRERKGLARAGWLENQTPEEKKLDENLYQQDKKNFAILTQGPLTRDHCMEDLLTLALFDLITKYQPNPWITDKIYYYAWDYLNKRFIIHDALFAKHLIAETMIKNINKQTHYPHQYKKDKQSKWECFRYACTLYQQSQPEHKQTRKQDIVAYMQCAARNNYVEYSRFMTSHIIMGSLNKDLDQELIDTILKQHPIDVNVQDQNLGNTPMHDLVIYIDPNQKNTIPILRNFIKKFRPNFLIKSKEGMTVIEHWEYFVAKLQVYPTMHPDQFSTKHTKQHHLDRMLLLTRCVTMFKEADQNHSCIRE